MNLQDTARLRDLKVLGDSTMGGGTYNKATVTGTLNLSDNLFAEKVKIMGTLVTSGDVECGDVSIMGKAKIEALRVRNSAAVMGMLDASDISAESFDVKGLVECRGGFESSTLKIHGAVNCGGLLNADSLYIKSKSTSKAGEIGGREIKVRCESFNDKTILKASVIEFDKIDIECAEAETVRGKDIIIGKNCNIANVEYTGTYNQHPDSSVGKAVKV